MLCLLSAHDKALFSGFAAGSQCRAMCEARPSCVFYSGWASGWCRLTGSCDKLWQSDNVDRVTVVSCSQAR